MPDTPFGRLFHAMLGCPEMTLVRTDDLRALLKGVEGAAVVLRRLTMDHPYPHPPGTLLCNACAALADLRSLGVPDAAT